MAARVFHGELHISGIDSGTPRNQWNGDPFASKETTAAFFAAVDAFQEAMRQRGYSCRYGYGITAREVD